MTLQHMKNLHMKNIAGIVSFFTSFIEYYNNKFHYRYIFVCSLNKFLSNRNKTKMIIESF